MFLGTQHASAARYKPCVHRCGWGAATFDSPLPGTAMYLYDRPHWPRFVWDHRYLEPLLGAVRHRQGFVLGRLHGLAPDLRAQAQLRAWTREIVARHELDSQPLDPAHVQADLAQHLGLHEGPPVPPPLAAVATALDAVRGYARHLTAGHLRGWHAALCPLDRPGAFRQAAPAAPPTAPAGNRRPTPFRPPPAAELAEQVHRFLVWFNDGPALDPVLKAGVVHLWFTTLRPFDGAPATLAGALADVHLARADAGPWRAYSLAAELAREGSGYHARLAKTQRGPLDITPWLDGFLGCLDRAFDAGEQAMDALLRTARFWEQSAARGLSARQRAVLAPLVAGDAAALTSSQAAAWAHCSQDTAGRDIAALVARGLLVQQPAGGRNTHYCLVDFL